MAATRTPAPPKRRAERDDASMGTLLSELSGLVVTYAKQETVDPLKALGRYVAWGVLGAVFISAGGGLLALASLRAIQFETGDHLTGNWSWVPYSGGALLALAIAGLATSRIGKRPR